VAEGQAENEFGGQFNLVAECEVEVDVEAFSYQIICFRRPA